MSILSEVYDESADLEEGEIATDLQRICGNYNSTKGCRDGSNCRLRHERLQCAFFGTNQGCSQGNSCLFSHSDYAEPSGAQLRRCPGIGCDQLCIGKQCRKCFFSRYDYITLYTKYFCMCK